MESKGNKKLTRKPRATGHHSLCRIWHWGLPNSLWNIFLPGLTMTWLLLFFFPAKSVIAPPWFPYWHLFPLGQKMQRFLLLLLFFHHTSFLEAQVRTHTLTVDMFVFMYFAWPLIYTMPICFQLSQEKHQAGYKSMLLSENDSPGMGSHSLLPEYRHGGCLFFLICWGLY